MRIYISLFLTVLFLSISCGKPTISLVSALSVKSAQHAQDKLQKAVKDNILAKLDSPAIFNILIGIGENEKAQINKIVTETISSITANVLFNIVMSEKIDSKTAKKLKDAVDSLNQIENISAGSYYAVEVPVGNLKGTEMANHPIFSTT